MFSRKRTKSRHPEMIFNGNLNEKSYYQKHLGIFLESTFDFDMF